MSVAAVRPASRRVYTGNLREWMPPVDDNANDRSVQSRSLSFGSSAAVSRRPSINGSERMVEDDDGGPGEDRTSCHGQERSKHHSLAQWLTYACGVIRGSVRSDRHKGLGP